MNRNFLNVIALGCMTLFTACKQDYGIQVSQMGQMGNPTPQPPGSTPPPPGPSSTPPSLCVQNPSAAACNDHPVVSTPGVVTVLFTVSQIPLDSAKLIVKNAIKYASPVSNPKILFVKDTNTNGEDEGDADFIKNTLLAGYQVEYGVIPSAGLDLSQFGPKDLVIVSNPGHPLSAKKTMDELKAFAGGVILIGDDLSRGASFDMNSLTGLVYLNNGSSISCNGNTYPYDNNNGYKYQITMTESFFPGIPASAKRYEYGNDIDHVSTLSGIEVLASFVAQAGTCDIGTLPAVVRKPK